VVLEPPYLAIAENLRCAMRFFSRASDEGEVRESSGVSIVSSGLNYGIFNTAHLTTPVSGPPDLERRISIARVHFSARGLSWSFWVCEDLLDRAVRRRYRAHFLDHGFRQLAEAPGMYAEALTPATRKPPALDILRVRDAESRFAFAQVAAVCFDLPFTVAREIYAEESPWAADLVGYVGYHKKQPVSTAAAVRTGDAVGIYSVATLPAHQRRGFGEAMVRHAVQESGTSRSLLQSSRAGISLYERLGYRLATRFSVFILE
jgi:GNAT superfamily N-acetyltransferase